MKMYGIANCDTVKKARLALEKKKINVEFIDFKKSPPTQEQVLRWKESFGDWPVNKKGPTFRNNKEAFESGSEAQKLKLILDNSSMIKRPILEYKVKIIFGFDESIYSEIS